MDVNFVTTIDYRTGRVSGLGFKIIPDYWYSAQVPCQLYGSMPKQCCSEAECNLTVVSQGNARPQHVWLKVQQRRAEDDTLIFDVVFLYFGPDPFLVLASYQDQYYQQYVAVQNPSLIQNGRLCSAPVAATHENGSELISLYDLAHETGMDVESMYHSFARLRGNGGQPYQAACCRGNQREYFEIGAQLPVDPDDILVEQDWADNVLAWQKFNEEALDELTLISL